MRHSIQGRNLPQRTLLFRCGCSTEIKTRSCKRLSTPGVYLILPLGMHLCTSSALKLFCFSQRTFCRLQIIDSMLVGVVLTFCVLQILGDCVTRRALVPQRRRAQRRPVQHAVAVHVQLRLTRRSSSVSSVTRPGRGGMSVGRDCRPI